ncbi:hypothetical protein SLEP1_g46239 [Rubroshorea leprosula]|uniref:Small ribosomal subunit protein mS35 mitochondrial conserved domain-containing protein n=1 Tax=Rubroshorea leprosula TaxID=152421 RepID=A0AAV5LLL4_9ROSI|nr:hypothetical protein SLEP1_g46239 [Rubroshorea leprosula]
MMRRALWKSVSLYTRNLLISPPKLTRAPSHSLTPSPASIRPRLRFFSSESEPPNGTPDPVPESTNETHDPFSESTTLAQAKNEDKSAEVEDVSSEELKTRIENYFKGDETVLPSVFEAILSRRLTKKHEEADDALMEQLHFTPLDDVKSEEFESDFEELYSTDEEIDNLYNARDIVTKRMVKDEYFNMTDKKWDDMIKEAVQHGHLKDTKECEEILEDMLSWDKLLPDDIKKKVEMKFEELGDMCERQELEPEEAYERFKEFEDELVNEYLQRTEAEAQEFDQTDVPDNKKDLDDPPGEGPILRWQTRVVFTPGGDAWHPKNRKVKMSVTVKELGLSKHQFRRLRELAGKRYNPGNDELTITSERFEHREENRKDCLRTLLSLIEEAAKADKLVEEARTSYVKERLRANPAFMARLHAKSTTLRECKSVSA